MMRERSGAALVGAVLLGIGMGAFAPTLGAPRDATNPAPSAEPKPPVGAAVVAPWTDPTSGIAFVFVPGGSFEMGCGAASAGCNDDEKPQRRVSVQGFWMGRTEVTQGQWQRIMGHNPAGFPKGDSYPVEQVSWDDVKVFIQRLNDQAKEKFRLPSEAEWEYACRYGRKKGAYCGGDRIDALAWYSDNAGGATHPVGTKKPNEAGIFDLNGNVLEWVEDCWFDSHIDAPPTAVARTTDDCTARVLRGGSWAYDPWSSRSTIRYSLAPTYRFSINGFRLARTLEP